MTLFRPALVAVLLLACAPLHAATNYQDMWWKPTEAGWGLMVLQQEDTLSAVMFHYRPDRKPTWYLLSNGARAGETFSGTLIETEGPPLFGAYDPATLVTRPVGTMSIAFSSSRAGVVTYAVNGETASKQIERITFGPTKVEGDYLGSNSGYAACPGTPSIDLFTFAVHILIAPNGAIRVTSGGSLLGEAHTCDWTAPLLQTGAVFTGQGTWICKNAAGQTRTTANFVIDEMRVIDKSVLINYHATSSYPSVPATCTERGTFAGVRR